MIVRDAVRNDAIIGECEGHSAYAPNGFLDTRILGFLVILWKLRQAAVSSALSRRRIRESSVSKNLQGMLEKHTGAHARTC